MTCNECLAVLGTAAVSDLRQSSLARQHGEECEHCGRVIALITHGEHDLAFALDHGESQISASHMAAEAIRISRRRRVTYVISSLLAITFAITLWVSYIRVIAPAVRETAAMVGPHLVTETLELRCLSPARAGELIQPYLRSSGSAYYAGKEGMNVITVRGTAEELVRVTGVLQRFDRVGGSACRVVPGGGGATAPRR